MSHLQGTDYVGSMVVFEDGLAKRSRLPPLQGETVAGNDDYAAMEEVLTRRLTALLAEEQARRPAGPRTRRDGRRRRPGAGSPTRPSSCCSTAGKGQLNVGVRVLERSGSTERIPIAALAKSFEEVYRPGSSEPDPPAPAVGGALPAAAGARRGPPLRHHLPPRPPGQADDRGRLDDIPGLGPTRRARLRRAVRRRSTPLRRRLAGGAAGAYPGCRPTVGAAVFDRLHTPMSPGGTAPRRAKVER